MCWNEAFTVIHPLRTHEVGVSPSGGKADYLHSSWSSHFHLKSGNWSKFYMSYFGKIGCGRKIFTLEFLAACTETVEQARAARKQRALNSCLWRLFSLQKPLYFAGLSVFEARKCRARGKSEVSLNCKISLLAFD